MRKTDSLQAKLPVVCKPYSWQPLALPVRVQSDFTEKMTLGWVRVRVRVCDGSFKTQAGTSFFDFYYCHLSIPAEFARLYKVSQEKRT